MEKMHATESADAAFHLLRDFGETLGLPWAAHAYLGTGNESSAHGPQSWYDEYYERDLFKTDPTLLYASKIKAPFSWQDDAFTSCMLPQDAAFMGAAASHSINCGFSIPLIGLGNQPALLSFASPDPRRFSSRDIQILQNTAIQFQMRLRILHRGNTGPRATEAVKPALTKREIECLTLLAMSLTRQQAAVELDISESTVRHHMKNTYVKLGVTTAAGAVYRAWQLGLIDNNLSTRCIRRISG